MLIELIRFHKEKSEGLNSLFSKELVVDAYEYFVIHIFLNILKQFKFIRKLVKKMIKKNFNKAYTKNIYYT